MERLDREAIISLMSDAFDSSEVYEKDTVYNLFNYLCSCYQDFKTKTEEVIDDIKKINPNFNFKVNLDRDFKPSIEITEPFKEKISFEYSLKSLNPGFDFDYSSSSGRVYVNLLNSVHSSLLLLLQHSQTLKQKYQNACKIYELATDAYQINLEEFYQGIVSIYLTPRIESYDRITNAKIVLKYDFDAKKRIYESVEDIRLSYDDRKLLENFGTLLKNNDTGIKILKCIVINTKPLSESIEDFLKNDVLNSYSYKNATIESDLVTKTLMCIEGDYVDISKNVSDIMYLDNGRVKIIFKNGNKIDLASSELIQITSSKKLASGITCDINLNEPILNLLKKIGE